MTSSLIALAAMLATTVLLWNYYQQTVFAKILSRPLPHNINLHIPAGASLRDIAALATDAGMPLSVAEFIISAKKLNISAKLQAGHYEFESGDSANYIFNAMATGKVAPAMRFTIIEGITYRRLRELLLQDQRLEKQLTLMSEDALKIKLQAENDSLEGLFLPETYFFNRGDSDLDLLVRARNKMKKTMDELWQNRRDDGLFKTPYESLALASIVEKETGIAEERPLIAAVFANRLRKGIALYSDPTIIYGLGEEFDGNLTRAHLRDKSNPYNTYARRGLTPTPIALPGKAAIAAALNPPASDYYYFVASGDGGHVFSKTLREHNNAVNKYQRRRRKK